MVRTVYKDNIERATLHNNYYRKVVATTAQLQLVLMSLPDGVEIGDEVHPTTTQFIRVESGTGVAYVSGKRYNLKDGDAIVIPPNSRHNIKSTHNLKLYTIYSPPEHAPNTLERTKDDSDH